MKHITGILILLSFLLLSAPENSSAQAISRNDALTAASNYLNFRHPNQSIGYSEPLTSGNEQMAWLIHCQPKGFVIISTSTNLPPILAWSEEGNFGEGEAWDSFLPMLKKDLQLRNKFTGLQDAEALKNHAKWEFWMNPATGKLLYEQWPPEGWSSTGGWLFTNWTQTAPYNALCPIDGQTHVRSVAGCPATAMAQIVNFHHRTNETRFSDEDDYYHSFGAGNSYWIDDDWESFGFPSWYQLNVYLDTLEAHYEQGITLKNTDKAALTYACGAAAKQVYSSSVSGTYGINQAYDAFIRFGYSDAQLLYPTNPELNARLADNIKIALPAQLGLVNPTETAGHNVVVDGYNTDELYHFNFGWGGSANGWYTLPPGSIPYDLTVIEGVVLDINLSNSSVGTAENPKAEEVLRMYYSNETCSLHCSSPSITGKCLLMVFNSTGNKLMQIPMNAHPETLASVVSLSQLPHGLYIARLSMENGASGICKFVR
jgi:hypothetical protein